MLTCLVAFAQLAAIPTATLPKSYATATLITSKPGFYSTKLVLPQFGTKGFLRYASYITKIAAQSERDRFLATVFPGGQRMDKQRREVRFTSKPLVTFYEPKLISLVLMVEEDNAGAHPHSVPMTFTFASTPNSAYEVHLADIFREGSPYAEGINRLLLEQLVKDPRSWAKEQHLKAVPAELLESFVVTPKGLLYVFEPATIGPHAAGVIDALIPGSKVAPWIPSGSPLQSLAARWKGRS
jgi:hypothetical protein